MHFVTKAQTDLVASAHAPLVLLLHLLLSSQMAVQQVFLQCPCAALLSQQPLSLAVFLLQLGYKRQTQGFFYQSPERENCSPHVDRNDETNPLHVTYERSHLQLQVS